MKNLKTIFILFFVLSACGYQPLLVKKEINFKFNSIETIGNDRLSYRVIRGLNHLQDKNSKYDIKINIIDKKYISSKDAKGNPAIFNLLVSIELIISKDDVTKTEVFTESLNFNNRKNKFELKKIEDEIKLSLIDKLTQNILFYFQSIQE